MIRKHGTGQTSEQVVQTQTAVDKAPPKKHVEPRHADLKVEMHVYYHHLAHVLLLTDPSFVFRLNLRLCLISEKIII